MELQDLDIDKYIEWYKQLSLNVALFDIRKDRYKRLCVLSYLLHTRYILNPENIQSKQLSADFSNAAAELEKWLEKIKLFKGQNIYYIPAFEDWREFDSMRRNGFEALEENLTNIIKQSALPEIEILKNELRRKKDEDTKYLHYYISGTAFINSTGLNQVPNYWAFDLSNDVSNIDYCIYLSNRIKELENPTPQVTARLQWKGTAKDFSELVKALSLTALKEIQETEIIRRLGDVVELKGKPFNEDRHRVNINELQDKKPSDLFTAKMNKEVNIFFKSLLDVNE